MAGIARGNTALAAHGYRAAARGVRLVKTVQQRHRVDQVCNCMPEETRQKASVKAPAPSKLPYYSNTLTLQFQSVLQSHCPNKFSYYCLSKHHEIIVYRTAKYYTTTHYTVAQYYFKIGGYTIKVLNTLYILLSITLYYLRSSL